MPATPVDDVGSVLVVAAIVLLFTALLRERVPSSWPRSLWWLAPVGVAAVVFAVVGGGSGYLVRWVGRDVDVIVAVLVVAVVVAAVTRLRGGSWALALWFAGTVVLIGMTTLPSASGAPELAAAPAHALRVCVTGRGRWGLPDDLGGSNQIVAELIPNVALFAPLGAGLVLARSPREWRRPGRHLALTAVLLPLLVSVGIESYQALFTTRYCSPTDVMSNTLGGVVGAAAVAALLAVLDRAGRDAAVERTAPR